MAASTPVHASSASAWGSAAILGGLPKISGRGGNEALEGPGSVEVTPLSPRGEGAVLAPVGAAGAAGCASEVQVVLAIVGAAGAAPVVSGVPPALGGGSVVLGAGVAPVVDGASADAQSSSSPAARGGVTGVAVDAGSGPGVVWLVFLFFLLFFSCFFSLASLGRKRGEGVRKKGKPRVKDFLQEYSRGIAFHPPSLDWVLWEFRDSSHG
jgi:hypothetical protein